MNGASERVSTSEGRRRFALEVVGKLHEAGFEALWAGGCVRDQLMGKTPKDYDVATNASPEQVREVFGPKRTHAVGAAFGVITVHGPRDGGQIEVATFRQDVDYTDGRRPNAVAFTDARTDALRRDFTINGMFYNPVRDEVIDFVGGRDDLEAGIIRAIGRPKERFTEDKLRLLRAIRFAARMGFEIEESTWNALVELSSQIVVVSPERIAAEMRQILVDDHRVQALHMLQQSNLLPSVCPPHALFSDELRSQSLAFAGRLHQPTFPLALAAILAPAKAPGLAIKMGTFWRLSNVEIDRTTWLLQHIDDLLDAEHKPWSHSQRLFAHDGARELTALFAATRNASEFAHSLEFALARLEWPPERVNPAPLINGQDLLHRGFISGPAFRTLLEAVRNAQLDGVIHTKEEALALSDTLYRGE